MLSKTTQYAIRAMVYIYLQNSMTKRPGVSEIAQEIKAPVAYSAKILHTLTKHGMLDSAKGRGGGFFFTGNQSAVSLYEVIRVMEGDGLFSKCGFGLKNCNDDIPCPLHDEYNKIRNSFSAFVKRESIRSLSEKILEDNAVLTR
jgi:Rrf2 family protein